MPSFAGLTVNSKHHLMVDNCDVVSLAQKHGTPLYIYSEKTVRERCRAFLRAIRMYAPGGEVSYASKAFANLAVCSVIREEGLHFDAVSVGELYTAYKAGFAMEHVNYHGNSKTQGELEKIIEMRVGRIIVDSMEEITRINELAGKAGIVQHVLLRVNPGIAAHTDRAVQTARTDCKFGMGLDTGSALDALKLISHCSNLRITGFHVHLGSQIFEVEPYLQAIDRLTDFMMLSFMVTHQYMSEINLGGGFGVRYTEDDPPTVNAEQWIRQISERLGTACRQKNLPVPHLLLEPGRYIVAEAGLAVYQVQSIRRIPEVRTYAALDGSMADNPRFALYGSRYTAILANRADERPDTCIALAGHCCESGDMFGYDFELPMPVSGDYVAIPVSGAYHMSMASNYNRMCFPEAVMVCYGNEEVISRRQMPEEVAQYDVLPVRLQKGTR